MKKKQLIWKCRRGMKEMDIIFLHYLNNHYSQASESDKQTFETICDMPDVTILDYLFGRKIPENNQISHILNIMKNQKSSNSIDDNINLP